MVPLLVVTYIGGLIDSGRAIGMQAVLLGREASRAVLRRACFGLAVTSVLPVMLAVFLAEWAVAFYLGQVPDGEVMVVLFVQCCVLLSIAPMAIALLINKRATAGGTNPLRVVGSMLGMTALMMTLSFAVPHSPGTFLGMAAVLLVTGWWQVGLYLRWYYGTKDLVVR